MTDTSAYSEKAISLLKELIAIPSYSKEENKTADLIEAFLKQESALPKRVKNNVFAFNAAFDASKPTVLLCSHHDTVKPNPGYTKDPFTPILADGKLYGLGSNDAGASLVSLLAAFLFYHEKKDLTYNLCYAAVAEEEISGPDGMELFLKSCSEIYSFGKKSDDFAIIGEPTLMQMAVAEKGLMVLDCTAKGVSGHAAREEGVNALYKAMKDIAWFEQYAFERVSPFLGPVKMTVTSVSTENKAHNVVPNKCDFIVDLRVNELYTFDEILDTIRKNVAAEVVPRSTRIKSSMIPEDHVAVKAGLSMGKTMYGSPTTSDKAIVGIPALKIGPGDSARSHTADEYVLVSEIENGIQEYIVLLDKVLKTN